MKFVQYRFNLLGEGLQEQAAYVYENFSEIANNLRGILRVWADPQTDGSIFIPNIYVGKHFGPDPDLNRLIVSLTISVLTREELNQECQNGSRIELPVDCIGAIRFLGITTNNGRCRADVILCITPNPNDIIVHDLHSTRMNETSVLSIQDIYLFITYLRKD